MVETSKKAVSLLLKITWRSVAGIAKRIVAQGKARRDPLEGLKRIGIDEISFDGEDAGAKRRTKGIGI